jgi:hypothetical protein
MSTVKPPNEKKKLSLARDCRNTYGENDKASRKSIPKGKQTGHQMERRAASAPLARVKGAVPEEIAEEAEFASRQAAIEKHRKSFKMWPDQPLGMVIKKKATSKANSWKAFGDLRQQALRGLPRPNPPTEKS